LTIVAHAHPFVIGVDTHARTHTLAVVSASTGEQLACEQFPATAAGMKRATDWAGRRTDQVVNIPSVAGIEYSLLGLRRVGGNRL